MIEQEDNSLTPASNVLTEQGLISLIEGEFAYVQTQKQSACGGCATSSSCGTSALASYFNSGRRNLIKVKNLPDGKVGDEVVLMLDESRLLKHSFMAYGVPLLGLFIVAVLFKMIGLHWLNVNESYQDILSIVGGFLGIGLGWLFTHKTYQPVLPEMKLMPLENNQSVELEE